MPRLTLRTVVPVVAGGAALTLAACGSSDSNRSNSAKAPAPAPVRTPAKSAPPATMSAHSGATLTVAKPAAGAVVTANTVAAEVRLDNFQVDCRFAGTPNRAGVGHYHVLLDGKLINMFCSDRADVSLQNINAGKHELEVVPAVNDHTDDLSQEKKIAFDYQPVAVAPVIKPIANPGKPAVTITSPKTGATVSKANGFDLVIQPKNLHLSCALYGKNNLAGYGHWHINVDSTKKGMMGMGTMLGMSCRHRFHVSLAGIPAGKHTFFAMLEDNQHAPTLMAQDTVTLDVR